MVMRTLPVGPNFPVGAVMSGGGARAAYQVGVLRAIAAMLPRGASNPFAIICGTSAGAINATSLASNADRFAAGVARLVKIWGNLHIRDVYRSDLFGILGGVFRCLAALLVKNRHESEPVSVLDCSPLSALLGRTIDFGRIQHVIAAGHLHALSVTASSYVSGDSVTFYQGNGAQRSWRRAHRVGRSVDLALSHVLASCALPLVFPAVPIDREHFGDGSMHQLAPVSAALHLGARRVLVIAVGSTTPGERIVDDVRVTPSLAQIAGHLLNAIFIDTLDMDLERLQRVNQTLASVREDTGWRSSPELKAIDTLVIRPSERIEAIASAHARELPRAMRFLGRRLGVLDPNGAGVLSYLLFERAYCRDLIDLGFADGMSRREEIRDFLGYRDAVDRKSSGRPPRGTARRKEVLKPARALPLPSMGSGAAGILD
jgi:NTE family protein